MTKSFRVHGKYDFTLEFKLESDRTYAIRARSWPENPHSDSEFITHVHPKTGKICVQQGKEPRALDKAIAIGQLWCLGYVHFIETGKFPNNGAKVNV